MIFQASQLWLKIESSNEPNVHEPLEISRYIYLSFFFSLEIFSRNIWLQLCIRITPFKNIVPENEPELYQQNIPVPRVHPIQWNDPKFK